MPIYTYRCQTCGALLEKKQKFDDLLLRRCPACRNGRLARVIQPSAVIFKGKGWYSIDNRAVRGQASKRAGSAHKGERATGKAGAVSQPDKQAPPPAKMPD